MLTAIIILLTSLLLGWAIWRYRLQKVCHDPENDRLFAANQGVKREIQVSVAQLLDINKTIGLMRSNMAHVAFTLQNAAPVIVS